MSLRLKNSSSNILIGTGGSPTEDDSCCCSMAGCSPCAFKIQNPDFSILSCADCGPSSLPEWDGSFCPLNDDGVEYDATNVPGTNALSFGGMILWFAYLRFMTDHWVMSLVCDSADGSIQTVVWIGVGPFTAPFDPAGVYNVLPMAGCSAIPASFTVGAC